MKKVLLYVTISSILLTGCSSLYINDNNDRDSNIDSYNENESNLQDSSNETKKIVNSLDINVNLELHKNKQVNINNGGYAAENRNWIFYSNSKDGWKLYKINKRNTSERIKLSDDVSQEINILNNKIYFYYSNHEYGETGILASTTIEGTEFNIECKIDPFNIKVINNDIFFIKYEEVDDANLYKLSTVEQKLSKISNDNIRTYYVYEGWIYFNNENYELYRMKNDGTEKTKLCDSKTNAFIVLNNYIIYINLDDKSKIYVLNVENMSNVKLLDEKASEINMLKNWIYYSNIDDNDKLYKIKVDGTGKVKLCDDSVDSINVIDNWIYYRNNNDNRLLYRIMLDGSNKEEVE